MTDTSGSFPIVDFNPSGHRPAGQCLVELNRIRDVHRAVRSSHSPKFWMLTRYDDILAALRRPDVFSSCAITVLEPSPKHRWIPEMLDPPEHTTWRRLLRPLFTPARAKAMHDRIRGRCVEIIDRLRPAESCELVADFTRQYPTAIFLELLGLPAEQLPRFLEWEYEILHQPDHPGRTAARGNAIRQLTAYLADLIDIRRREPRDDIVTAAIHFNIDGRAVTDDELVGLLTLLFLAGLDTVTAALTYMFWHLATHPADRERITKQPGVVPAAAEELLRAYPIIMPARKLTADVHIGECPMREGDMVMLPLPAANNDPDAFPNPDIVDFDRAGNHHIAFGAGPHRCLGAHLARAEIQIALTEWHKRIPHYTLAANSTPQEHADQVIGLERLDLTWKNPGSPD